MTILARYCPDLGGAEPQNDRPFAPAEIRAMHRSFALGRSEGRSELLERRGGSTIFLLLNYGAATAALPRQVGKERRPWGRRGRIYFN